jgi:hypothetical protein
MTNGWHVASGGLLWYLGICTIISCIAYSSTLQIPLQCLYLSTKLHGVSHAYLLL